MRAKDEAKELNNTEKFIVRTLCDSFDFQLISACTIASKRWPQSQQIEKKTATIARYLKSLESRGHVQRRSIGGIDHWILAKPIPRPQLYNPTPTRRQR